MTISVTIVSVILMIAIGGIGACIAVTLVRNNSTMLALVVMLGAVILVNIVAFSITYKFADSTVSTSSSTFRTITIYDEAGNVMARYEGDISDVVYCDGYIQFDYDGKEYVYQNCLVEMVKEG